MSDIIRIYQGNTKSITFTVKKNGAPVDLADKTMQFTVKRHKQDEEPTIQKDAQIANPTTSGVGVVDLTSDDTDIEVGKYFFDVQVFNESDTFHETFMLGEFYIDRDLA